MGTAGIVTFFYDVKIFQIKAKEITGKDIEIDVGDINTDVNVEVNLNDLARTDGIVSAEYRSELLVTTLPAGPQSTGHADGS